MDLWLPHLFRREGAKLGASPRFSRKPSDKLVEFRRPAFQPFSHFGTSRIEPRRRISSCASSSKHGLIHTGAFGSGSDGGPTTYLCS